MVCIIYIIKQDIHIYIYIHVAYSRTNGWTDWAEIFCGHSRVAEGCLRLKKIFFSTGNVWSLASIYINTLSYLHHAYKHGKGEGDLKFSHGPSAAARTG